MIQASTLEAPCTASVIYFLSHGGRFSQRRLAILLKEIEAAGEAAAGIEIILAGDYAAGQPDRKADEALRQLLTKYPSLRKGPLESGPSGGELLNRALCLAQGSRIVFVDHRAQTSFGSIFLMLRNLEKSGASACFVPQPEDSQILTASSGTEHSLNGLVVLLRRLGPIAMASWDRNTHESVGYCNEALNYTMLSDLLIRMAEHGPVLAASSELASLPSQRWFQIKEARPAQEQQTLDEQYRAGDEALARFVDGELPGFEQESLAKSLALQARTTMEHLRRLQSGESCSLPDLAHTVFAYALLSLRLGQVADVRQIFEVVSTIISEQRDLTQLYKWLVMRYPLGFPLPGVAADRIEPVPAKPKVVVATPLFNQGRYLREAMDSVLAQSYENWEMVIVDDSSTDNSYELAKAVLADVDDPRIKLFQHENAGLGATRNRAIKESEGQYVVCLDADDMIAPDHFAICLDMLDKNPRAGWISPKTIVFGGSNHIAFHTEYDFIQSLLISPSACSSMIRRNALGGANLFREDLTAREDWEAWIAMAEAGWIAVTTSQPLFMYRHALRRPGLKSISNIPSKEEVISLHPWWYRVDFDEETRLKAYSEFGTVRFSPWFLNMANVERIAPVLHDQEAFLSVMESIRSEYGPITKPKRWQNAPDDCFHAIRRKKYGIPEPGSAK